MSETDLISRQAAIDAIKTWGLIDGLSEGQAIEILADEEKLPSAQPEILACGQGELVQADSIMVQDCSSDLISRQAAIDEIDEWIKAFLENGHKESAADACLIQDGIIQLPSAQPELCEYYALCRHGRDENKLRVRLGFCEYCNEDSDGYVKPIEKNNHAFVRFGMNGWELSLKANGWHGSVKIRYCPMCGRRLVNE